MLFCPDCGSTDLTLRAAESSPAVQWFNCPNGHRFFHKTGWGKSAEFAAMLIACTAIARLFLDHPLDDFFDFGSG
jgi:hypothetical protein